MAEEEGNQYPMVVVKWADAHSGPGHWSELDPDDRDEYIVSTIGFVIDTTKGGKPGHVTVAQSYTPDDDFDHVLHIPSQMVRTMQYLQPFTRDLVM